jgi:hypothetical protein
VKPPFDIAAIRARAREADRWVRVKPVDASCQDVLPLCDALEAERAESARLRSEASDEGGAATVIIEIRSILGLRRGESTIETVRRLRGIIIEEEGAA